MALKVTEGACRIEEVEENETIFKCKAQNWFKMSVMSIEIKSQNRWSTVIIMI